MYIKYAGRRVDLVFARRTRDDENENHALGCMYFVHLEALTRSEYTLARLPYI